MLIDSSPPDSSGGQLQTSFLIPFKITANLIIAPLLLCRRGFFSIHYSFLSFPALSTFYLHA